MADRIRVLRTYLGVAFGQFVFSVWQMLLELPLLQKVLLASWTIAAVTIGYFVLGITGFPWFAQSVTVLFFTFSAFLIGLIACGMPTSAQTSTLQR